VPDQKFEPLGLVFLAAFFCSLWRLVICFFHPTAGVSVALPGKEATYSRICSPCWRGPCT
jgi:hypothetical protein